MRFMFTAVSSGRRVEFAGVVRARDDVAWPTGVKRGTFHMGGTEASMTREGETSRACAISHA
jgi:hypothetical protein